jgi:hypothetical protein
VESLEALNIQVNYWWNDNVSERHDPMLSQVHAMALMFGLPADQRDAWREIFECLVFQRDGVPGAHLPANLRNVMGNLSPADADRLMAIVAERMQSQAGWIPGSCDQAGAPAGQYFCRNSAWLGM